MKKKFDLIAKDIRNETCDEILEHISEVKRITIDEFNACNRLGNEGFRKRGYIEAAIYFEEYIKNLKEENK